MIERTDPVNWSSLKYIDQSPKHYRHNLVTERPDSEAMQLGRLTHCAVYEPEELHVRYVQEPNFHRGMKDETAIAKGYDGGKEAAAAFDAGGRETIKPDLWARALNMADALASDPIAGPMIRGGFAEQLITWTDPITGIECRGRVDHVNGCLSDLKTSRSVEPRWFASNAVRLQYHGQIAYYADGLAANGIALTEPPAFIVVENVEPHDVVVLNLSEADIAAGRTLYRRCLERLAWCREHDRWPGVSGGERLAFPMPGWAAEPEQALTLGGEAIDID